MWVIIKLWTANSDTTNWSYCELWLWWDWGRVFFFKPDWQQDKIFQISFFHWSGVGLSSAIVNVQLSIHKWSYLGAAQEWRGLWIDWQQDKMHLSLGETCNWKPFSSSSCICHWEKHVTGSLFFLFFFFLEDWPAYFFHWIQKIFTQNSKVNFWLRNWKGRSTEWPFLDQARLATQTGETRSLAGLQVELNKGICSVDMLVG